MVWTNQIIFWIPLVLAVLVLLSLWRRAVLGQPLKANAFRLIVLILIIVFLLQTVARVILYYYALKNSTLGVYLLPGKGSNYFYSIVADIAIPFLFAIVSGIALALIAFLVRKFTKKAWFEQNDIYLMFITGFLVGFPNVVVLVFSTLLLMIIWQLVFRKKRVGFAPFLIFASIAVLLLSNFAFYQDFLALIYLV